MQGKKLFLDQEVVRFRLSEWVRPHNLYRHLAGLVDWSFLYDATRDLYSHTGKPSLDPVVFFKMAAGGGACIGARHRVKPDKKRAELKQSENLSRPCPTRPGIGLWERRRWLYSSD